MRMKNYKVLVYARNFRIRWQEGRKRERQRQMGFFAARFVKARNPPDAELRAMEMIRRDEHLRTAVLNRPSDPPIMFAESIVEVPRFRSAGRGYTFFHGRGAGRPRSVPLKGGS